MSDIVAILLGVLEGLTEFIPVSSTGHLILLASALDSHSDAGKVFEVFIQFGAILAVVCLYWKRFWELLLRFLGKSGSGDPQPYSWKAIVYACIPPLILGYLFYKHIKTLLFHPIPVALALIVGGIGLILVDAVGSREDEEQSDQKTVSDKNAFFVGLFQCLSLWPGMSRSGSCIIGARYLGISRVMAAEFSFVVAVPIISAAVGYDLLKNWELISAEHSRPFLLGFLLSFFIGGLSIKFFISYLQKYSLIPFGVYRIVLGLVVLCAYTVF